MEAHEKGFFTEANSVEVVTGRNKNAEDERLKAVMEAVSYTHLTLPTIYSV